MAHLLEVVLNSFHFRMVGGNSESHKAEWSREPINYVNADSPGYRLFFLTNLRQEGRVSYTQTAKSNTIYDIQLLSTSIARTLNLHVTGASIAGYKFPLILQLLAEKHMVRASVTMLQ